MPGNAELQCSHHGPEMPVQASAAAHCTVSDLGDAPLPGFVLAQSPAAVPDLLRLALET